MVFERITRKKIEIKTNDNINESMHHKFVIIDNKFIFNGSLNWSKKGVSKNHENVLFLENEQIVSAFSCQFNELWNKFKNIITLNDIENKGKFFSEKKYLPKRYYQNYNRYKNYFDRNGYKREQFEEYDGDDDVDSFIYHYENEEEEEEEKEEEEEEEENDEEEDYDDEYEDNYHRNDYDDYDNYDDYDDYGDEYNGDYY